MKVVFIRTVGVKVFGGDVGEDEGVEGDKSVPEKQGSLGGHLHDCVFATGVDRLAEESLPKSPTGHAHLVEIAE